MHNRLGFEAGNDKNFGIGQDDDGHGAGAHGPLPTPRATWRWRLGAYLEWRIPQIEDLKATVLAADETDFATDAEVSAVLAKHTLRKTSRLAAKTTAKRRAA